MMVLSIQTVEATQKQLINSISELKKHYSLYVSSGEKIVKIKDKAFWELLNEDK
jgi:DNA phosphorothioation-dependent restriction protein DptH